MECFFQRFFRISMYFLHEHPYSARSWNEECVKKIMNLENVQVVKGDMCCFGMWQEFNGRMEFVKKSTGFMTNAQKIAEELNQGCPGTHTHVHLLNGRAKRAEVYPTNYVLEF